MLFPAYLRRASYYFHIRLTDGKQFKRTLRTRNKSVAMIRASKIMDPLMEIDLTGIRRYEIDLKNGLLKSDGEEDHARMM